MPLERINSIFLTIYYENLEVGWIIEMIIIKDLAETLCKFGDVVEKIMGEKCFDYDLNFLYIMLLPMSLTIQLLLFYRSSLRRCTCLQCSNTLSIS